MRIITTEEKKELLGIPVRELDYNKIVSLIGNTLKNKARFEPEDRLDLSPNEYFNKERVTTTVGRLIFNKYLLEEDFADTIGYINDTMNKKGIKELDNRIGHLLLNDIITVDTMVKYLDRQEFLSKRIVELICGSFTARTISPNKKVIKRRDELIKKNEEALKSGDVITAVSIENELVKLAKEELGDDPGVDLFNSGARGSFENNYKNNSIMRGPIYNPITGQWDIIDNSFMEGIKKDNIDSFANTVTAGAYPKAIGTGEAGYFSKQIIAAMQGVVLDKPGSDCGTTKTLSILLSKDIKAMFMYRYMKEGNKLVLLDDSNIDKYIGKMVNLRSPLFNIGKKLCRTCAGELYTKLGIENIGLTSARVASTLLNLKMKAFHNSTVSIAELETSDMFL